MTDREGMSYFSLRCVLEYLEANRRIHITARSPALRNLEKRIPLHINNLTFTDWKLTINDIVYTLQANHDILMGQDNWYDFSARYRDWDTIVEPGDLLRVPPKFSDRVEIMVTKNGKIQGPTRLLGANVKFHQAIKTLSVVLLGGRSVINVNKFLIETDEQQVIRLPENLKLRVRELEAMSYVVKGLSNIITDPVKSLKFGIYTGACFEHPIFKTSETVDIRFVYMNRDWVANVANSTKQNFILHDTYSINHLSIIMIFVRRWMQDGRDVGRYIEIDRHSKEKVKKLLDAACKEFAGKRVILKEKDKRALWFPRCVSLPLSSTSELVIYGLIAEQRVKVMMKVIPVGGSVEIRNNWFMAILFCMLQWFVMLF